MKPIFLTRKQGDLINLRHNSGKKGAASGMPQKGEKVPPFLCSRRGAGSSRGLSSVLAGQRSKKKQCLNPDDAASGMATD